MLVRPLVVTGGTGSLGESGRVFSSRESSQLRVQELRGSTRSRPRWHLTRHVYGHDTMNLQAAECDKFIDYSCIQFHGKHTCHNQLTGKIHFQNLVGPGWGQPLTGVFYGPRLIGRRLGIVRRELTQNSAHSPVPVVHLTRVLPDAGDREVPERICYLLLTDSGWV